MKFYVAKSTKDNKEYKFDSLKKVRDFVRSAINANEVRGIEEIFEIYKEVTKRKKLDTAKSNPSNFCKITEVI